VPDALKTLVVIVSFVGISAVAVLFLSKALLRPIRGKGARAAVGALLSLLLGGLAVWVWALHWASSDSRETKAFYTREVGELGRMYDALKALSKAGIATRWPPDWRGQQEPLCLESGGGSRFEYVSVGNLAALAKRSPAAVIAYSPPIHRDYWWAPWARFTRRFVLRANGSAAMMREADFQKQLQEGTRKARNVEEDHRTR